jgi:hypothetical protein
VTRLATFHPYCACAKNVFTMYKGSIFASRIPASPYTKSRKAGTERIGKGRELMWESTGSYVSLVLLGRGGGGDVTVLELGETTRRGYPPPFLST